MIWEVDFYPAEKQGGGGFYDRRFAINNQRFFKFCVTFMSISEGNLEAHEKNNYFETVSFSARKNSKRSKNQRLRGITSSILNPYVNLISFICFVIDPSEQELSNVNKPAGSISKASFKRLMKEHSNRLSLLKKMGVNIKESLDPRF